MLEKLSWKAVLLFLCSMVILAALLSLVVGDFSAWLAGILLVIVLWNYQHQIRLSTWLWGKNRSRTQLQAKGSWEGVFYGLQRLYLRNKKRNRELTTLIKWFRHGAESLPDAVVLISTDGVILWCNQLAERLLGLRWPQDNKQNILNLVRYPELKQYLDGQDFAQALNLVLHNQTHAEFRLMPYAPGQLLMIVRDMTPLRQLEISRRQFFNNASHELKTPLTVLKAYVEMMQEDAHSEPLPPSAIQAMLQQTLRMESLVSQLLLLAKLDSSAAKPPIQSINLSQLVNDLIPSLETLNWVGHTVTYDVATDVTVHGFYQELQSVVQNLIENALSHNTEPVSIHVSLKRDAKLPKAIFSVSDTGVGIPAEHIPFLTERFYRVDAARTRQTGGTGLGLAIVKHVLRQHGSELAVSTKVGHGSTFSFVIATH